MYVVKMAGGNGWPETVIRAKDSQEQLWDAVLDITEKNALTKIIEESKSIERKTDSKLDNANKLNPIINKYFTIFSKQFDEKLGDFVEVKKENNANVVDIQKNVEIFYGNLLEDLRSHYESLKYEKKQDKQIEETLQLASSFVDILAGQNDAWFVRKDQTPQQTEEKFKSVLRALKQKDIETTKTIHSDVEINIPWYVKIDTQYTTEKLGEQTKEWRYRLPMADIGTDAMENNFADITKELNHPWVKIIGYEITGLASTVDYTDNKQIAIGNETFTITENTTLADARSRLAEDWLKKKFNDKFTDGYQWVISSKTDVGKEAWVNYNDPAHPEYKQRSTTSEWREKLDKIFGPYQGVDMKVQYYIEKEIPHYTYELKENPKQNPEYNVVPKIELLIKENNNYKQYEVSGEKLDQDNPMIKWWSVTERTWNNKDNDMFDDNTCAPNYKWKSIITRKFEEYTNLSQEDPINYPPITDPKNNTNWIDKMSWVNTRQYDKWEKVSNTSIMNLDISNLVHKDIYTEMKKVWILTSEWISNQKTDKYISEYMEKWTKQYVQDGIEKRNRKQ